MRSLDRKMRTILIAAVAATAIAVGVGANTLAHEERRFNIGRPVSEPELERWNIDIMPDGTGLPRGQGSVPQGKSVYEAKCIACHGAEGQGSPMDRLAGGQNTLTSANPVKTIGSYWPYATTIFDYVRRAMPLDKPQSLSADEIYAVTAYLLQLNGIIEADAVMDAQRLPKVHMPNRAAFRTDPRPDVSNSACRSDCK